MKWDVFISHASEDKNDFVKPLAKKLSDRGIKVWYDEFELKLGDSLSESIDKGLINSNYGLLILSKSFLLKEWTDYELRSLLTKEIGGEKVILPIWHNISKDELKAHSLYLADKFALSSTMEEDELLFRILEVVRPDIINSNLLIRASRQMQRESKTKLINISKINTDNPSVHKELPIHLIISTQTLVQLFSDVIGLGFKEMLYDFSRDWDYTKEFIVWNAIACSYLDFMKTHDISFSDIFKKRDIVSVLLLISMNTQPEINTDKHSTLTNEQIEELKTLYYTKINEIKLVTG